MEDREAIGTAFAAETNRRDEDTEMWVYLKECTCRLHVFENVVSHQGFEFIYGFTCYLISCKLS